MFNNLDGIQRYNHILADIKNLDIDGDFIVRRYQSVQEYEDYVDSLTTDQLLAHVYVRHMGDMFGGAMLKKVVPGQGSMYDFENKSVLIQNLRAQLHDGLSEEANIVFEYAIRLYEELSNEYNI